MKKKKLFLLSLSVMAVMGAGAKPVLPELFTSNMVMQQLADVPVWGTAKKGKVVTVTASWNNQTVTAKADENGRWKVTLRTIEAGGPYTVTISDGQKVTLENVMLGEVWLCSGQSNMEMPVDGWGRVLNFEEEKQEANQYKNIRLLQMKHRVETQPSDEVVTTAGGWQVCSAASVKEFSATGYFFGRDIHKYRNVPVGLIDASWGGTFIEPWTSADALAQYPEMCPEIAKVQAIPSDKQQQLAFYSATMSEWGKKEKLTDPGYKNGKAIWASTDFDDSKWETVNVPCEWGKMGLGNFDGVMWYRHEVDIPKSMAGKDLILSLGWVDDIDYTFFNGESVGEMFDYGLDRKYTIPGRLVKAGRNVIAIRVIDIIGGGGIYHDAASLYLEPVKGKKNQRISLAAQWRYKLGPELKNMPSFPNLRLNQPNQVNVLYNAMINPIVQFPIRGAIWYQGCNNEQKGYQYRELLPLMIRDWREKWGNDFPFYIVQLANFRQQQTQPGDDLWAEVREAQAMTAQHVENSGLACTIDIGDAFDIHPRNKQEVGRRLALQARAKTYGEKIEYSGPVFKNYQIEGGQIRVFFDHAEGLTARNGEQPKGFAIAGSDRKFYWATARIEGNSIVVSCPEVKFPVAVRYAWHENPICNIQNKQGLPAVPFRTDDWAGKSFNVRKAL